MQLQQNVQQTYVASGDTDDDVSLIVGRFITARRYASAVLGVVILSVCLSVRLSVCPSVTRVLYD